MNNHSAGWWIGVIVTGICIGLFGPIILGALIGLALGAATVWLIAKVLRIDKW